MTDDQRRPPAWLFKAANPLVRALLRSPFHRPLSSQLMLLSYTGPHSGRRYTIPIGYFWWDDTTLIAFSSQRWWRSLRGGQPVRLLVRGRWQQAAPAVSLTEGEKATLLGAFVRRYGPRAGRRLLLGLPAEREPTGTELDRAATRTAIIRFHLAAGAGGRPQPEPAQGQALPR